MTSNHTATFYDVWRIRAEHASGIPTYTEIHRERNLICICIGTCLNGLSVLVTCFTTRVQGHDGALGNLLPVLRAVPHSQ